MGNLLYKSNPTEDEPEPPIDNNIFSLTQNAIEGKNILVIGKKGKGKSTLIKDIITKLPFKSGHIIHSDEGLNPIYDSVKTNKKIYKAFNGGLMSNLFYDSIRYNTDLKYFVVDTDYKYKSKHFWNTVTKVMEDKHSTLLMALEYINKEIIKRFDLIFIFKDSNAAYVQHVWEKWHGTREAFIDKIKQLENDHTCLVINREYQTLSLWPSLGNSWITYCTDEK